MPDPQEAARRTCPECGQGRLTHHVIDEAFEFDVGGEKFTVLARGVPVEQCDGCGAELSGPESARIRHRAVCEATGFLTPEEVLGVRERLNLSTEGFSWLLGVDPKTVSRWEGGRSLQDRLADDLLFLLAHSPEAVRLLEERAHSRPRGASAEAGGPVKKAAS